MPTAAPAQDQLDLFADLDAAAAADAEADRQRIFDHAPSMFGDTTRGFFARVEAMRVWDDTYGHFDCLRRSHGWRDEIGGHGFGRGRVPGSEVCRPITLTADLRCDHWDDECCCVGDMVYRGACLHCAWEGEIRADHNGAVEDAHDHAWAGWRELPIVQRRPEPGTNARQKAATDRWIEAVTDCYPDGWLEAGGPIRTARGYYGTRHVPNYTGFGGYDLCGEIEPEPVR
jgi:hypothetical protein